jgi:hypothetical protein
MSASVSTAAFDAVVCLCALECSRATGFVGAAIPARARLADSTVPSGVLWRTLCTRAVPLRGTARLWWHAPMPAQRHSPAQQTAKKAITTRHYDATTHFQRRRPHRRCLPKASRKHANKQPHEQRTSQPNRQGGVRARFMGNGPRTGANI